MASRGYALVVVCGLFVTVAALTAQHRLQSTGSAAMAHGLQLLRGRWNLPRPGIEPVPPSLADGFLCTVPPGTSTEGLLNCSHSHKEMKFHSWDFILFIKNKNNFMITLRLYQTLNYVQGIKINTYKLFLIKSLQGTYTLD